jgi:hypothetical protein
LRRSAGSRGGDFVHAQSRGSLPVLRFLIVQQGRIRRFLLALELDIVVNLGDIIRHCVNVTRRLRVDRRRDGGAFLG